MTTILSLSAALLLAAPAVASDARGEAALTAAIGDRQPRPPVDCIDPHGLRATQIVDGTAIVYDAGGRVYVNRPKGGGEQLRREDVLATRIEGGQLCRLDTVVLLDPVTRMQRGFVVLDAFTPYERPRR